MSEAVTVPSLMIMTFIVSEESLARDGRTHARTPFARSILNFFKVVIKGLWKQKQDSSFSVTGLGQSSELSLLKTHTFSKVHNTGGWKSQPKILTRPVRDCDCTPNETSNTVAIFWGWGTFSTEQCVLYHFQRRASVNATPKKLYAVCTTRPSVLRDNIIGK